MLIGTAGKINVVLSLLVLHHLDGGELKLAVERGCDTNPASFDFGECFGGG